MTTLYQYLNCSTSGVRTLDLQLIAQIQRIAPGVLVKFDHLPVQLGAGCHPYLQAPAVKALELAISDRGGQVMVVNSAYRTLAQQAILFAHFQHKRCGIKAAAQPGLSNHNSGLSVDTEDASGWKRYLERHGWDWIGSFDPMHFSYIGGGVANIQALSIKVFQQLYNFNHPSHAIQEDGRMGAKTMNALLSTSVDGFSKTPSGLPNGLPPGTVSSSKFPSLRQGMNGDAVKKLQLALVQKKIPLRVDGDFGPATTTAVKKFQKLAGLDFDGVVGVSTSLALGLR